MNNPNVKRVRTVKYSNMLDRLISIAEYSIFTDGNSKFATLIIYNSSDRLVRSFEMKLDIYDDNKAKIKTKIISINNLSLRPRLFLKLKAKISLPIESQGFNYLTTSINGTGSASSTTNNSVPTVNKPIIRNNYPSIKTREEQIIIHAMDAKASKSENIEHKTHIKTKWLFLLPIVGAASIALSSIYFFTKLNPVVTSTTRPKGSGELQVAEQTDFEFERTSIDNTDVLLLNRYKDLNKRKKLYLDPSVFIPDYSGEIIYLAENCFRSTDIERFIVQGPCYIGNACFAYASKLEYFSCVNYTSKNVNYVGELYSISPNSFFGCINLTTFKYQSSSVSYIAAGAYYGCEKLANFVLPYVTRIEKQAFFKCTSLGKELYLPATVERVGELSYSESSIKEVSFGNSFTQKATDSFDSGCKFYGSSIYDEEGEEI